MPIPSSSSPGTLAIAMRIWQPHSDGAEIRGGRLGLSISEIRGLPLGNAATYYRSLLACEQPPVPWAHPHSRYVRKCHSLASVRAHFDSMFYRCEWIVGFGGIASIFAS